MSLHGLERDRREPASRVVVLVAALTLAALLTAASILPRMTIGGATTNPAQTVTADNGDGTRAAAP